MDITLEMIEERKLSARKRARAVDWVINRVARGKLGGVLEKVKNYDISLPLEVMRQVADFYSSSRDHYELRLAQWAYQQIGDNGSARNVADKAREEESRPPWFG